MSLRQFLQGWQMEFVVLEHRLSSEEQWEMSWRGKEVSDQEGSCALC